MAKQQFISVTHFINPQLFWYHKIEVPNEHFHEIIQLEQKLSMLFNKPVAKSCPNVGDVVAVNFMSWNKCIRARVEQIAQYRTSTSALIVWAIDYGFPFQTKLEHIRRMPDGYTMHIDHIRRGSLAFVLPAETEYDFMVCQPDMVTKDHWNQRACESLEKIITDAASVTFIEHFQTAKSHFWGDLKIVSHTGSTFMASDYLVDIHLAIRSKLNFRAMVLNLKTTNIPRWLSNTGNNKFKHNVSNCTADMRMNSAADNSCDDFSKQKVEDWHARNERVGVGNISSMTTSMDCPIGSNVPSIDDIGFEDSVSIEHQPLFVQSLDSCDLDITEQQGFMRLAGAVTMTKCKKYSDEFLPKPPASVSAFEINIPEADDDTKDSDKTGKLSTNSRDASFFTAASSSLSSRNQKLIEMRKKLASKSDEQARSTVESVETISTVSNLQYQPLNESTFEETDSTSDTANSSRLQRLIEIRKNLFTKAAEQKQAKRNIQQSSTQVTTESGNDVKHLDEKQHSSSIENNSNRSEISVQSSRSKLFEMRRKLAASCSVAPTNSEEKFTPVATVSSYKEKMKLIREKQSRPDKKEEENSTNNDTCSTISAEVSLSYIESLKKTRKKIQQKQIEQLQRGNPEPTFDNDNITNKIKFPTSNQESSDPFDGIRMLPAGFDLSRLNRYKNENHWHCKKSTLNDVVPHDAKEIEELLLNTSENTESSASLKKNNACQSDDNTISYNANQICSSNQNFRHTRSHTDKYKEEISSESVAMNGESIQNLPKIDKIEEYILDKCKEEICSESVALNGDSIQNVPKINKIEEHILDKCKEEICSESVALNGDSIQNVPKINKIEEPILDSTVPNITEGTLKPIISGVDTSRNSKCEKEQLDVTDDVLIHLNSTTDEVVTGEDSSNSFFTSQSSFSPIKRRQLKSPAQQMTKMSGMLRGAQFEKELGETEVLDFNSWNSNDKLDSNSSNTEFDTANSENEASCTSKSSNKSLVIKTESSSLSSDIIKSDHIKADLKSKNKKDLIASELKLARLAKQFHNELNTQETINSLWVTKNSNVITLPEAQQIHNVDGEIKLQTKFIDHMVLAHSKVPQQSLECISEAFFLPEIHEEMIRMRVSKVFRIQAYSWPHLLRGNSLFVVNPIKSGKTWCYLPPICSAVSYRTQNSALPQTYGPAAIIMVPSALHVENINYFCRRLVSNTKSKITIVSAYGVRSSNETKIQLFNSCGILVITPANLVRLLRDNENESLIDPDRLQHFVIDDLDLILSRFKQDFEIAVRTILKIVKKPQQPTIPLQIVVTSRDWNSVMMSMVRWSAQPLLLIGDFLEAAVYGKSAISIKLRSNEKKLASILRFIDKHPVERGRVLIMCNRDDELDDVVKALTESGYPCIGYASNMDHESFELNRMLIEEWKHKELCSQILVCTDSTLPELKLQNSHNLIHYSMPTSWTKFTSRFAALAQIYENLVRSDFHQNGSNETGATTHSLILLDEENNMHLPRLIEFMKKHHQIKNIHPDILAVSKRVLVEREECRISKGTLLCPFMLEFGECDESRCDYRHNLTHFDVVTKENDIPTTGDIRIQILKVYSPTYYTARLLEHKSSSKWDILRRSDEAALFGMKLNMHYMNMDNCIINWPPKINDLCIYKTSDTYQRARILDVPYIQHLDVVKPVRVSVKLIDVGTIIVKCKSDELLLCDKQFVDFPAQAIDIRLMGIVPFDNERSWDSKATRAVEKWIMTDIKKNECVHANVYFSLANTIWVKNVIVMERLTTVGHYIYRVNLRRSLLKKEFGVQDNTVGSRLLAMKEEIEKSCTKKKQEEIMDEVNAELDDSINLMKFSSNDDTIEDSCDESKMCNKKKCNNISKEEINAINATMYLNSTENENWDISIENNNQTNLINIPLSNDKYTNIKDKSDIDSVNSAIHEPKMKKTVEQWCKLPLFALAGVEIGDEKENGYWTDIYMQCIDKHQIQAFQELILIIDDHVKSVQKLSEKKPVFDSNWLKPKQNCIVKYDNLYCRAKICGIFGEDVHKQLYRFFLCDYACFVTVNTEELYSDFLYETTTEIVEYTPYQAVHCKLAGITLDKFVKSDHVVKDYLYAYAVQERIESSQEMKDIEIHSFYILLYECDKENDFSSAKMFNNALLENNVGLLDPSTKHFLELTPSMDLISDEADINRKTNMKNEKNNNDEVVSFEEFLQIFNNIKEIDAHEALLEGLESEGNTKIHHAIGQTKALCQAAVEQQKKNLEQIKVPEKPTETLQIKKLDESEKVIAKNHVVDATLPTIPLLKTLHKRPQTEWYQTDCIIYLAIFAPDITNYHLEVTPSTLYFAAFINEEEHVLILNFLGTVEPRNVSHEIRGLKVIVRLVKSLYMEWPHLLHESTKYSWLKYNYNSMDMREIDNIQPQQLMKLPVDGNRAKPDSDNDDADGEEDLFQTFTPIVNNEDIHDPTADIF